MKKKKDKALQAEIVEIHSRVREVVNDFKASGASELLMNWAKDVEEWSKKTEDRELSKLIFAFHLWKEKDELKAIITMVEEKYYQYLLSCKSPKFVFIAHNDKEPIAREVRILLSDQGVSPIIMQEQANEGLPIINKLKGTEFDFAIVILTEDAKLKDEINISLNKPNVVMETGYCYGYLEKIEDVIIMHDEKVEIPSNINGVEYIKIDKDWKYNLLNALRARKFID